MKLPLFLLCLLIPLAASCRTQRQSSQALASQLEAREKDQLRAAELCAEGEASLSKEDFTNALAVFARARDLNPQEPRAWIGLGYVHFHQDELYRAAEAFHRAARLAPTRQPRYNLGLVFERCGRTEQAIAEYETALRLAPFQLHVAENLARCYLASHTNLSEARRLVDLALRSESRPEWANWLQLQAVKLESVPAEMDDATATAQPAPALPPAATQPGDAAQTQPADPPADLPLAPQACRLVLARVAHA